MESKLETTTSKKTPLEAIGDAQRAMLIAKNTYNHSGNYSSLHQNALSDGDEKGKGETDKGSLELSFPNVIANLGNFTLAMSSPTFNALLWSNAL